MSPIEKRFASLPLQVLVQVLPLLGLVQLQPATHEACPIFKLTFLLLLPQVLIKALPLMIGWFSLNVPSGLGLYYLSNTLLTTGQQVFLRKFSGAAL